jgi:CubicO group peptidase (beta-lactamase class C family)
MNAKSISNSDSYAALDAYVEEQMRRFNIPGASLAIVEGDQIVHLRGFGRAHPNGEAPTPQTPFFIGSLTKSFTALAVMQLVEAGKIDLDAPVQCYLPWFRVADPEASAQMTVRHLLNQTSGLPMLLGMTNLANVDDRPDAAERQVRALSTLVLTRPVGSKFEYSNLNYNVLGLIIEAASGESYADYIQRHIFDPLDMHHSHTSKAVAQQNGLAMGHRFWFGIPVAARNLPIPRGSLSSGQLISSAEDMGHYLIAQLNEGCYGSAQILSPAGIDEMHRGVKEISLGNLSAGCYGMGWFEQDLNQAKTYSHAGNLPDFSAFMGLVPGQQKAFVVLFNADPYGLPFITDEVGMGLLALLAKQSPPPIKLDFIQWVFRLLPLIPLIQVAGMIVTLGFLRYWQRNPASRPSWGRMWSQHILLPLIPNLSMVAILAYLRSSGLIRFMHFYMPDLAWIVRISGSFALVWSFLRSGLMLRAMRRSSRKQ